MISSFLGLRNSATLIGLSCTRCLFVNLSKDPLSSLSSSINFLLQGRRFPLKMDTLLGSSFFMDSLDWVAFWLCEELTWVFGEVLDSQVFMEGDIIGDTRDSLTAVAFTLEINVWLDFSANFCSRPSADTPAKQFIFNLWWNCQTLWFFHELCLHNYKFIFLRVLNVIVSILFFDIQPFLICEFKQKKQTKIKLQALCYILKFCLHISSLSSLRIRTLSRYSIISHLWF